MRKADVACGLVLLVLGLLVVRESLKLHIGWGLNGPEGGFFPFWLAVGLVVSSIVIVIQALKTDNPAARRPFIQRHGVVPVLKVALPAFGMVGLTEAIGLYPAAVIYIAVYMHWIGKHSWLATASVSLLVPLVSYFIFDKWFLIPMPKGQWQWISGMY
jgi:hypothetical protein